MKGCRLNLTSLNDRRIRGHLIEMFKVHKGLEKPLIDLSNFFSIRINHYRLGEFLIGKKAILSIITFLSIVF